MAVKKGKRMGRPPLPRNKVKAHMLPLRLTEVEFRGLKSIADKRGITIADLLMEPFRKG